MVRVEDLANRALCSYFTHATCLDLPGLSSSRHCHLIQLTTWWWLVDSSSPLFTKAPKTYGPRFDATTKKSIMINRSSKVFWYQAPIWTILCSNMPLSHFSVGTSTIPFLVALPQVLVCPSWDVSRGSKKKTGGHRNRGDKHLIKWSIHTIQSGP